MHCEYTAWGANISLLVNASVTYPVMWCVLQALTTGIPVDLCAKFAGKTEATLLAQIQDGLQEGPHYIRSEQNYVQLGRSRKRVRHGILLKTDGVLELVRLDLEAVPNNALSAAQRTLLAEALDMFNVIATKCAEHLASRHEHHEHMEEWRLTVSCLAELPGWMHAGDAR